MTDRRPWIDALLAVLGLFLPVTCVGCSARDLALCRRCRRDLDERPRRVRLVAGVRLDAAFEYEGLVRTVLLDLKLRGRVDLAGPLARRFGSLVRGALAEAPPGTVLLRVPPSRQGSRRRGFDPVVLLLGRGGVRRWRSRALRRVRPRALQRERAGRPDAAVEGRAGLADAGVAGSTGRSGLPGAGVAGPAALSAPRDAGRAGRSVLPDAGRVGRSVLPDTGRAGRSVLPDAGRAGRSVLPGPGPAGSAGRGQKERSAVERVAATVGTLRATGVRGRTVVVVDDVVTTGVTMAEAVRAVRAAGGRVVRCVAVASVEV